MKTPVLLTLKCYKPLSVCDLAIFQWNIEVNPTNKDIEILKYSKM